MTLRARFVTASAIALCTLSTYLLFSQASSPPPFKSSGNPNHTSGVFNPEKARSAAPTITQKYTLQRARDYHHGPSPVDCPKCKDYYYSLIVAPGGTQIASIQWLARRPTTNNHWYRCEVESNCGTSEFSDPNDSRLSCVGKSQCYVNRASDDGVGTYEDDIQATFQ